MSEGAATSPGQDTANRTRGLRFLVLGIGLIAFGLLGVMVPDVSNAATGTVLGAMVTLGGVFVIVQALRDTQWRGFKWQLLFGSAEVVGGILIILNPLKGAAAVALLVAIVLVVQGASQLGLALKIRPASGWWWLAGASIMTFLTAAGLLLRFPYALVESPGEMAGLAMAFAGLAFVLIALGWLKTTTGPTA